MKMITLFVVLLIASPAIFARGSMQEPVVKKMTEAQKQRAEQMQGFLNRMNIYAERVKLTNKAVPLKTNMAKSRFEGIAGPAVAGKIEIKSKVGAVGNSFGSKYDRQRKLVNRIKTSS
ncbi:MAG: hypothetical protein AABX52_03145 [Nanoarchaeota archaeon]